MQYTELIDKLSSLEGALSDPQDDKRFQIDNLAEQLQYTLKLQEAQTKADLRQYHESSTALIKKHELQLKALDDVDIAADIKE